MTNQELDSKTEELIQDQIDLIKDQRIVKRLDKDHLEIDGAKYLVVEDNDERIDLEQLESRYTDFFEKFHYIVGDFSKNSLRLKGFYADDQNQVPIDMKISNVEDYLIEYCSFGCSYFILERLDAIKNFQPYSNNSTQPSKASYKSNRSNRRGKQKSTSHSKRKSSRKIDKRSYKPNFTKSEKKHTQQSNQNKKSVKTVKDQKGKPKFTINKKH